ncbi:hypothetical protein DUT91_24800, partial [Phyllobacterium salinisoli]
ALFASAADLDPAKSYIVHWKLGAANTAVTFTANDQDVFSSGGDDTKGNNWGTLVVNSGGNPAPIALIAELFPIGADVETDTPLATATRTVKLQDLSGSTMPGIPETTPVTAAGTKPATGNYSAWQVNVADINSTPVAGVDVFWRVSPAYLGLTFWANATTPLSTVQAGDNIFYAFSTSASGGAAKAWVMSDRPYALTALPRVNNADMGFVDTLFFASADYTGGSINDLGWGELIPAGIQSYKYGTYIELNPLADAFNTVLAGPWPSNEIYPQIATNATYFFVLNNEVGDQRGNLPISSASIPYNYLKPSIKDLETAPPQSIENFLGLFVQNPDGTLFGSKSARKFYAKGAGLANRPPEEPDDGARDGDLPQATILYLANSGITRDTLTYGGDGLAVQLKKIPVHQGKTLTFLFYMNGYQPAAQSKDDVRQESPLSNSNYRVATTVSATGASKVKLASKYALNFASFMGDMKISYVDYYIEDPVGTKVYGPFPTAQASTST